MGKDCRKRGKKGFTLLGSVSWAGAPTPRAAELEVAAFHLENTHRQMRGFRGVRVAEIEGGGEGREAHI